MRFAPTLIPLVILAAPALAAEAVVALPDPGTIKVPDVSPALDPKVRKDGYKFYYFHNPAVSFAEAYQDLRECRAHLAVGGGTLIPGFVPWDESHRRTVAQGTPMFPGLVTSALAAIILPKMERGTRSNKMRRCMGTRGYVRYAIPEVTWNALNEGDEEKLVSMQAKLASGPKPADTEVTE